MPKAKQTWNPYLLPDTVTPQHYTITLTPDLEAFTFIGEESVFVKIKGKTSKVVLHALDLKVNSADICYVGQIGHIPAQKITFNKKMQTVTLDFGQMLEPGDVVLHIEFSGTLNDKMCGFYRTSYFVNGEKRWGAATQFEATDARRAFPCWDEPAKKAKFSIKLNIPEHMTGLSNMPTKLSTEKRVEFQTTPPMSTYLVAFIIADLEYIETYDKNGVRIRVYTTPGKKEHGQFGLDVALHTLPFLAEYYDMKYPLLKLDLVALPDFGSGAMENWGLETFRETALLVDPANSSVAARERVADVVDHELAHHWFGNLVTMQWWTHLWLNEGFANFVENKAVNKQFPEWERMLRFIAEDVRGALHAMDKKNSHAIEVDVKNPEEIREIFDTTTYSGGGSVNFMNEQYLSEEGFLKGLRPYLKKYSYGNATTKQLWEMLEKATGKPVRSVMGTYTRQAGYPLVIVQEKELSRKELRSFELKQQRFLFDGSSDRKNPTWAIPIGVIGSSFPKSSYRYMRSKKMDLTVKAAANDWIKLNPGTGALYRVLYPEHMRHCLAKAIKEVDSRIAPADRIGLLDDAFALARAGYLPTTEALELLESYRNEKNCYVWTVIASAFGAMDYIIDSKDPERIAFESYARKFFEPMALHMGWEKREDERNSDILLRSLLLRKYGGYGHQGTVTQAFIKFNAHMIVKSIDPDIRQLVYALVAENGTNDELEKLTNVYESTDDHQEKIRVLRAVGMTKNPDTIKRVLAFAVSDKVRKQDTPIVILSTGSNNMAQPLVWEFLKSNWKMFVERYHGSGLRLLSRMIEVADGFKTEETYRDVKEFFAKNNIDGAKRVMAETLEQIQSNVAWIKRDGNEINEWFLRHPEKS